MAETGSIVAWQDGLANLLANAPAWHSLVRCDSATEALKRIHVDAMFVNSQEVDLYGQRFGLHDLMPCAFISQAEQAWGKYAGGTQNYLANSGAWDIEFAVAANMQSDLREAAREFKIAVGLITDWMAGNFGNGDYAPFDRLEMIDPPRRVIRAEKTVAKGGDWFHATYAFLFNPEEGG